VNSLPVRNRPSPARPGAAPPAEPAEAAPERLPLAILGGGISGLALAFFAEAEGVPPVVFEKTPRPGGVIDDVTADGFRFERGPNTILDRDGSLDALIASLGLQERTLRAPLREQARYIWHGGRLHRAPLSPAALLRTRLFTLSGKLRLLREPWIGPVQSDESVEAFVRRRLGREVYERAVVPVLAGLWAGDPSRLSTMACLPELKELERSGSLFKGTLARRRAARGAGARTPPALVSFREGLATLPRRLAEKLGRGFKSGVEITRLESLGFGQGFRITGREGQTERTWRADQVVLAAEAPSVARWTEPFEPKLAGRLKAVRYCPLLVLGLGVPAASLELPSGFGFLAVPGQGLRALGVIFNSNFLPERAPAGFAALTLMYGGELDPEAVLWDEEELLDQARRDLAQALAWDGRRRVHVVHRWAAAIPQYGMDHFELTQALTACERRHPGLKFFGNWRGGVALADRLRRARAEAVEIARFAVPA